MTLVSLSEYGRLHGVSKQAAAKWKSQGFLVMQGDKVDVEASDVLMRGAGKGRFKNAPPPVNRPSTYTGLVDGMRDRQPVDAPSDPDDLKHFLTDLLEGNYVNQADAERIKENALAAIRILELQKKAGELVEMAVAEDVFFNVFRGFRDAWLNWPSKVGPLLAADLDLEADRVTEALTAYVHKQLSELGEPSPDFSRPEE